MLKILHVKLTLRWLSMGSFVVATLKGIVSVLTISMICRSAICKCTFTESFLLLTGRTSFMNDAELGKSVVINSNSALFTVFVPKIAK